MLLKLGVDISRLNKEIRRTLPKVDRAVSRFKDEAVITSTFEGTHSPGSLHYCNDAYDLRLPRALLSHELGELRAEIQRVLGKDYDVVLEKNHFHIEYDPKGE